MKLKALRVHGFKSFADATQIDFHDGITAVVGPNGCGKSNISDAIRWVLGEQRPTAIRGAKMEEAIFQGSVARRPVNRGSVSLVVTNEDGALPVPFEEVEIGRTVYRDGGSDYQLNRASCRLRDVVDLCRDTGLGANAYSVIENRMIDAILSDRADERRGMFEEAAGIGKYKDRRKAALRRLETAEVDLQRLEDVIGEVQTKVRSLARQKGKAQRYDELRTRRLAVEVEVVRADLEGLAARLTAVDRELESDGTTGQGVTAQLRTAETELEEVKIRLLEAQRARSDVAGTLEDVRSELAQVEKAVAVSGEQIGYGKRRLTQISEETVELEGRKEEAESSRTDLAGERATLTSELDELRKELATREEAAAEVRERLGVARRTVSELEDGSRKALKRIAQLEGDYEGAQAQVEELGKRYERLSREMESGAGALNELRSQGDLFADRQAEGAARVGKAEAVLADAKRRLAEVREAVARARTAEVEAERAGSSLEAEHAEVARSVHAAGGAAAVAKEAAEAFPENVLGTLSDHVKVESGKAFLADAALGAFARALVVSDSKAVDGIRSWYGKLDAPGALILLPSDGAPSPAGALPDGIEGHGAGKGWIEAILGGLDLQRASRNAATAGEDPVTADGSWIDRLGAVHLISKASNDGVLERRERLTALHSRLEDVRTRVEEARSRAQELEAQAALAEDAVEEAGAHLLAARDEARAVDAEVSARSDETQRLDRHQEELARQLQGTRAARDRAVERGRSAEEERAALLQQDEVVQQNLDRERKTLATVDAEWEEARQAESGLALKVARAEHELERLDARLSDLAQSAERAEQRIGLLAEERVQLERELDEVTAALAEGQTRIQELFGRRDEVQAALVEKDRILEEASSAASEAERRVREIRAAEREAVDRRHQLELERQDIQNRVSRIRERLETEWGRPLDYLLSQAEPVEGDREELRSELQEIVVALERLGPVNMLAVEEHAEESERLEFLIQQRDDLVTARDDLRSAIRQINQTATELFMGSFEAIRANFRQTFERLFTGGQADLWLEDPENPLESAIEIHASPAGKKTQRIDLLSGGERALTALSLLFGIYLVKPSPFCVLDEVDAPLDESNIGRFIRLLQSFKDQTQFVVITHNPRTIEAADWIYGVTMEEPGVSSIVGVRLQDALESTESAA